jgi:large subunit ribosomal protein L4
VVNWQLARRRGGTACTKLMSEVSGSTRKIVRQKGSGGARHGSKRAVQFVGGRTCFGPRPLDFSFTLPKKIIKGALGFVLRDKIKNGKLLLVDKLENLPIGTGDLHRKLQQKNIKEALIVCGNNYKNFNLSIRNLYRYKCLLSNALNVYDMLKFDYLLADKKILDNLREIW